MFDIQIMRVAHCKSDGVEPKADTHIYSSQQTAQNQLVFDARDGVTMVPSSVWGREVWCKSGWCYSHYGPSLQASPQFFAVNVLRQQ